MPRFVVRPHEGVGPIDFGMTRGEVIGALGPPSVEDPGKLYYSELGIRVDIDDEDGCVSVEAWERAHLSVESVSLAGRWRNVVARLEARGYQVVRGVGVACDSFFCRDLGVMFGPEGGEEDERVETAGAYPRGYWEVRHVRLARAAGLPAVPPWELPPDAMA